MLLTMGDDERYIGNSGESCQPGQDDPAFASVRPLPRAKVEEVLRRYLELRGTVGGTSGLQVSDGSVHRGAPATLLWISTVARKLATCPRNKTPAQWSREIELLCFGRMGGMNQGRGLVELLEPADFRRLFYTLLPSFMKRVSLPERWMALDDLLVGCERDLERVMAHNDQAPGQLEVEEQRLRRVERGIRMARSFMLGHQDYHRSMEWLGQQFARCAKEDRSFLGHLEVEDKR